MKHKHLLVSSILFCLTAALVFGAADKKAKSSTGTLSTKEPSSSTREAAPAKGETKPPDSPPKGKLFGGKRKEVDKETINKEDKKVEPKGGPLPEPSAEEAEKEAQRDLEKRGKDPSKKIEQSQQQDLDKKKAAEAEKLVEDLFEARDEIEFRFVCEAIAEYTSRELTTDDLYGYESWQRARLRELGVTANDMRIVDAWAKSIDSGQWMNSPGTGIWCGGMTSYLSPLLGGKVLDDYTGSYFGGDPWLSPFIASGNYEFRRPNDSVIAGDSFIGGMHACFFWQTRDEALTGKAGNYRSQWSGQGNVATTGTYQGVRFKGFGPSLIQPRSGGRVNFTRWDETPFPSWQWNQRQTLNGK